jgi:hypothetical protein
VALANPRSVCAPHPFCFHRPMRLQLDAPESYLPIIATPVVIVRYVILVHLGPAPFVEGLVGSGHAGSIS